ncbi:MAG: sulfatase, partial [Phycisphaerae bacterium]|nr:sulfatase [Phycisphaerae bacterium]
MSMGKLAAAEKKDDRPNILWILAEDICPDLSCYGVKAVKTPHLDKFASQGIRFTRAFTTAPVCSASRSAMMTGFHQNYIGAHQHRTRGKKPLPYGIKPIPHLLAEAGYFTCLMDRKTDCNFTTAKPLFKGKDWKQRKDGQPFFAQYTSHGTHRRWNRDRDRPIDIKDVEIPPYYPDNDFVRRDWANGLEQIQLMDRDVGRLLKRLDDEGLADKTVVFFIGDHGRCHIRGKQFLYDGGIHIPLIVRWPGRVKPGTVRDDLVSSIDISAAVLGIAGIDVPPYMQGRDFFAHNHRTRRYVFAARDRCDETV